MQTPRHIAIIMDGNGRWAQRRNHPRTFGHVRGASRVKSIVREADRLGVKALTLYAFSTENWGRPETELKILWKLLKKFLKREADELDRENVRLRVIGEVERLGPDVREVLDPVIDRLSTNTGLQLTFAVSYGSRKELLRAASSFAADCVSGRRKPSDLDEALMEEYLWTADLGELSTVDLVIRTSGEYRVSNFLLWQAAYAEYVFFELCWPDFTPEHLAQAVAEYGKRERRFGGIGKGVSAVPTATLEPRA
jgi:undecaprenyl diphosphate synthase